jgi:hypothetical protein
LRGTPLLVLRVGKPETVPAIAQRRLVAQRRVRLPDRDELTYCERTAAAGATPRRRS